MYPDARNLTKALLCVTALFTAGQTFAGDVPYTWIDEKGNFHMVDSLTAVPAAHRKAAQGRVDQGVMAGEDQGGTYNKLGNGAVPPAGLPGSAASSSSPAEGQGAGSTAAGGETTGTSTGGTGSSSAARPPAAAPQTSSAPVTELSHWQSQLDTARAQKAALELELQGIEAEMLRLRIHTPPGFHQAIADLDARRTAIPGQLEALEQRITTEIPAAARRAGANASRLK